MGLGLGDKVLTGERIAEGRVLSTEGDGVMEKQNTDMRRG